MNRLQTALRNSAVNGVISLPEALKIAQRFDEEEEESINLLTQCKSHVGMVIGDPLRAHLANLKGTYHNSKEFNYERPVGEQ